MSLGSGRLRQQHPEFNPASLGCLGMDSVRLCFKRRSKKPGAAAQSRVLGSNTGAENAFAVWSLCEEVGIQVQLARTRASQTPALLVGVSAPLGDPWVANPSLVGMEGGAEEVLALLEVLPCWTGG